MDTLNLRIIHTHDTEENWNKCKSFIPHAGEVIVYDADETYSYARMKVGDGKSTIENLPFSGIAGDVQGDIVYFDAGRITQYK